MKQLQTYTAILTVILCLFATYYAGRASQNYNNAVRSAMLSDGTDAGIEEAMRQYGFDVDAVNCNEPSELEKLEAIFKQ